MRFIEAVAIDTRLAIRRLVQFPLATTFVITVIVLVLTANIAIFSMLNALVLRKVAIESPDDLVFIEATDARTNTLGYFYRDSVAAFRAAQRSLSHLAMYSGGGTLRVEPADGAAFTVGVEAVEPEYFELVRIATAYGRPLTRQDDAGPATVVMSFRLADSVFGAAQRAVGASLTIGAQPVQIVGVAENGFTGLAFDGGADLYVSFATLKTLRASNVPGIRAPHLIGRLAPGASITTARAELAARWPAAQSGTMSAVPSAMRDSVATQHVRLEPLAHGFSGLRNLYGKPLIALMGLALILLTAGIVNLGGLCLARGIARRHHIAIQRALGASRARLLQQSVIEGLFIGVAGLLIALPIAWWLITVVTPMLAPRALPLQQQVTPNGIVLFVAAAVTLLVAIAVTAVPAWGSAGAAAASVIQGRRTTATTLGLAGRAILVLQVALAMVLVSGASMFVATVANLYANDSNPRSSPILWTRLSTIPGVPVAPTESSVRTLVDRLSEITGVDRAALSMSFPAYMNYPGTTTGTSITRAGEPERAPAAAMTESVTPGFFAMFGISQIAGRDFDWATDTTAGQPVAIINRALATALFSSADALGRELLLSDVGVVTPVVVVGVVEDALMGRLDEPHVPVVFRPLMQNLVHAVVPLAHVRVHGDLDAARAGYVDAINSLGRHEVRALFTLDQWVDDALLQERLVAGIGSASAALALVLAGLGIFASLAFSVSARTRELGIRISVGASPAAIVRLITRETAAVMVPGILAGAVLAVAASRFLVSLLYGVSAVDPRVMIGAAATLACVGVVASLAPALRAGRVEPMVALQRE